MPLYRLVIAKSAFKQIEKIDRSQRNRVRDALIKLADNPYPEGKKWKRLQGTGGEFLRLRVGNYRVMYAVVQDEIQILGVVHRRDLDRWIRQR
jgi:mRNA interferase RelE/StbE